MVPFVLKYIEEESDDWFETEEEDSDCWFYLIIE